MSNAWKSTLSFLFLILALLPVSVPLLSVSGKPVELVPSDFLIIFSFSFAFFAFAAGKYYVLLDDDAKRFFLSSFSIILIFIFFSIFVMLFRGGSLLWFASLLKLIKPFFFIFFAFTFFRLASSDIGVFCKSLTRASVFIIFSIFISDLVLNENFPFSRLGGSLFGLPIYGFPNSSVVLIVVCICFNFLGFYFREAGIPKLILWLSIAIGSFLVVMSFSRTGLIALLFLYVSSFILLPRTRILISSFFVGFLFVSLYFYELILALFRVVFLKMSRVFGEGEALSGREDIWAHVIELISQRPIFGFGFEPFSVYSPVYETPHQQYLEIIYKSGVLGFVLLVVYTLLCLWSLCNAYTRCLGARERALVSVIFMVFLTILITNFVQPSFGFSIIGNISIFLVASLFFLRNPDSTRAFRRLT